MEKNSASRVTGTKQDTSARVFLLPTASRPAFSRVCAGVLFLAPLHPGWLSLLPPLCQRLPPVPRVGVVAFIPLAPGWWLLLLLLLPSIIRVCLVILIILASA